jgi:hypothetical protein
VRSSPFRKGCAAAGRSLFLAALFAAGCGGDAPQAPPAAGPAAAPPAVPPGAPQPPGPPPAAPGPADEAIAACLRTTWNLGRDGVRRASCDVHVDWDRRYFREPIRFGGRYEFADGAGRFRWNDREADPAWDWELTRFLDPDWLRKDLTGAMTVASGDAPGVVVLRASGENRLHARSVTFAADGTLASAVVRTTCGDGVEREGARTFVHETRAGRTLLVSHRTVFAGTDCSEEWTYKWEEQDGRSVPAEIRCRVAAGKEYDDTTFRLSAWMLEPGPRK